jgi:hypothetical protein
MKSKIEKIADAMGVFSPIIILLLACSSYLCYPVNKNLDAEFEKKAAHGSTTGRQNNITGIMQDSNEHKYGLKPIRRFTN